MIDLRQESRYFRQLGLRLGLILLLFSLVRLLFYYFNRSSFPLDGNDHLPGLMIAALRFDLAAIVYINSLFILLSLLPLPWRQKLWYQRLQLVIFLCTNGLALAFELIDVGFFRFAFRRTIGSDFSLFRNTAGMIPGFVAEYWYLPLFFIALIYGLYRWYWWTKVKAGPFRWLPQTVIFLLGAGIAGIAARGGLQLRPIMPITAAEYVDDMRLTALVNNTSLSLIFSSQQRLLKDPAYLSTAELSRTFNLLRQYPSPAGFEKKNVVIIVLESFGKEHVGYFNPKNAGYTPFLDSLMEQSWFTAQSYANGLRSTQGIVAISAGIPPLMNDPLMFSAYQSNRITGLADILAAEGYRTAFFHGANPGSMEFERFSRMAGFQEYHDRTEYANDADYDSQWGIWDQPFFQYTAKQLEQGQKPFFAMLFSLTSHHPYRVPSDFLKQYPDDPKLLRTIRYTDAALRDFFQTVSNYPWFEETLFVITADHIGQSSDRRFKTRLGKYQIPILFFDPMMPRRGQQAGMMQQIDIMPTVLDWLGYQSAFISFGESALDSLNRPLAYTSDGDLFQIADTTHLLVYDGQRPLGWYRHEDGLSLKKLSNEEERPKRDSLLQQLQAIIQVHHRNMIDNTLVIDKK